MKMVEESRDTVTENYESARSLESRSIESKKQKKKVNFASPPNDRFSSANSYSESAGSRGIRSTNKFDESIGESIRVEESYQIQS